MHCQWLGTYGCRSKFICNANENYKYLIYRTETAPDHNLYNIHCNVRFLLTNVNGHFQGQQMPRIYARKELMPQDLGKWKSLVDYVLVWNFLFCQGWELGKI